MKKTAKQLSAFTLAAVMAFAGYSQARAASPSTPVPSPSPTLEPISSCPSLTPLKASDPLPQAITVAFKVGNKDTYQFTYNPLLLERGGDGQLKPSNSLGRFHRLQMLDPITEVIVDTQSPNQSIAKQRIKNTLAYRDITLTPGFKEGVFEINGSEIGPYHANHKLLGVGGGYAFSNTDPVSVYIGAALDYGRFSEPLELTASSGQKAYVTLVAAGSENSRERVLTQFIPHIYPYNSFDSAQSNFTNTLSRGFSHTSFVQQFVINDGLSTGNFSGCANFMATDDFVPVSPRFLPAAQPSKSSSLV